MAEESPSREPTGATEQEEILSQLARSEATIAAFLSRGTVSIEVEVEVRAKVAGAYLGVGTIYSNQTILLNAIRHLETILRRIPETALDRPRFLNELSKAEFEMYRQTNSTHSLDLSIVHGEQSKELAIASGIRQHDRATYLEILSNLGFILMHRFTLNPRYRRDVDESINCKREILEIAEKGSDKYFLALNNLASSYHRLYVREGREENDKEAQRLLGELLSSTEPGSQLHNIAVGQLGIFAYDKFNRSGLLEDLDEALVHCKQGFESSQKGDDSWMEMLKLIVHLYTERQHFSQSPTDMESVVHYSCLLFESTPSSHSSHGQTLLKHLQRIQQYALEDGQSLERLDDALGMCRSAFTQMPAQYESKELAQLIFTNLLSQRYVLSGNLQDLLSLMTYSESMTSDYNAKIHSNFAKRPVFNEWEAPFSRCLEKLSNASPIAPMRQLAEEELFGCFLSCYDPDPEKKQYGLVALETIYFENGKRLEALTAAAEAGITLSEDEIEQEVTRARDKRTTSDVEFLERLFGRPSEYKTTSGARTLSVDPETDEITFDFSSLLNELLGYGNEPLSPDEFIAREARMDRETLDKARSEGMHPNPRLCHWCRRHTRPLRPIGEQFELCADRCIVPVLGDWKMILYCRDGCAVCSLAASMIRTAKGQLHPTFASLDEEARGIGIEARNHSTGETVLRVDCGILFAGELRVLTEGNFRRALRQGWEAEKDASLQPFLGDQGGAVKNVDGQQVDLKRLNAWLNECDHNHGSICNHPRPGKRIGGNRPLVFIDVIQQCLVHGTTKDKYFALSYTWGQVDMCKTTEDNYEGRQYPQALSIVPFPKTIRDAITLASSLGVRLLWVDVVCIIQDDPEKKASVIPDMDIIYGKAFATIVALSGVDADSGLPGIAPGSRSPQQVETLCITPGNADLDCDTPGEDNEIVHLIRTPRPFYLALQMAKWNTRGWTMQERLLSRRCIYFSSDAVYFQCGQTTWSEAGLEEGIKADRSSPPTKDEQRLWKANHDNPIANLTHLYDSDPGIQLWEAFEAYKELVRGYSKREFTDKADILKGFGGVFAVLDDEHFQGSSPIPSTALHGLPSGIFIHALLWSPAARMPRRGARLPTQRDTTTGTADSKFPSWAWAGWDGPVDYSLFAWVTELAERPIPLIKRFVVGSLEVFPDKWEEAGYLIETGQERWDRTRVLAKTDTVTDDALVSPTTASDDGGSQPGPAIAATSQSDNMGNEEAQAGPKSSSKGKEKVVEKTPRAGKLWQDPNTKKLWVFMPVDDDEAGRKRDPPTPENVLQMRGPVVPLTAFRTAPNKEYLSSATNIHAQSSQSVRRINDSNGNHCGLYWEQGGYEWVGNGLFPEAEKKMILLGVSAYGTCWRPREGPNRVEGPIRLFDSDAFPDTGPGSGLVIVLVVDMDAGHGSIIGERCSIGVIHSAAWERAGPVERGVKIA